MRLYDVEQSAQNDIVDANQDIDIQSLKGDISKKFAKLKV